MALITINNRVPITEQLAEFAVEYRFGYYFEAAKDHGTFTLSRYRRSTYGTSVELTDTWSIRGRGQLYLHHAASGYEWAYKQVTCWPTVDAAMQALSAASRTIGLP